MILCFNKLYKFYVKYDKFYNKLYNKLYKFYNMHSKSADLECRAC